jgi:diguanylate cyclase (GGDEF)-like protein
MWLAPFNKVRKSFSAKIILLVALSVIVTSFVVGLATTHSTGQFLTERMKDRFPSTLTITSTRLRLWHDRQMRELARLGTSRTLQESLARIAGVADPKASARYRADAGQYLKLVHPSYTVFEDLLVLDASGSLIASAAGASAADAAEAWSQLDELGLEPGVSPPMPGAHGYHQWFFVPAADSTRLSEKHPWMVARVNLATMSDILGEVKLGDGGDLYLLEGQGRFLTEPRLATMWLVGMEGMQVPTRQTGPVIVERRKSYGGREVFHSKIHFEELGWWLVYEEDYDTAMAPVLEAQRRIWVSVLVVGAMAILAALRIAQSILKPIKGLALGASRINEGLVGVKIPRGADDEIGMMIDTFNEMATKISLSQAELQYKNKMLNSQNDRLQDMNEQLEKLSVTDGLTGLFNHRHFWNLLNTELTRVNLHQGHLALVLLDLDDFKKVNDKFGHSVGDLLLQTVGTVLSDTVRDTDIVARYGGEEFGVLLPDTDESGVQQVAEKIRASIEAIRFSIPETDIVLKVTVSIGVSVFRGNRREFFNAADRALYKSKAAGKNCVHYALT